MWFNCVILEVQKVWEWLGYRDMAYVTAGRMGDLPGIGQRLPYIPAPAVCQLHVSTADTELLVCLVTCICVAPTGINSFKMHKMLLLISFVMYRCVMLLMISFKGMKGCFICRNARIPGLTPPYVYKH